MWNDIQSIVSGRDDIPQPIPVGSKSVSVSPAPAPSFSAISASRQGAVSTEGGTRHEPTLAEVAVLARECVVVVQEGISRLCELTSVLLDALAKQEGVLFRASGEAVPVHPPEEELSKIVEGVFDGELMVAHDGKTYFVPPKTIIQHQLLEGDLLELTIDASGDQVISVVSGVERDETEGALFYDREQKEFYVRVGDQKYWVQRAGIALYKLRVGQRVRVALARDGGSKWAALVP